MPGLANRAPTAQEHSPKRIAQSEEVLLPVGKCAGGGGGVKQQGLVCDKEDKCQCWICFSGRQNCTVAILAQGTHWAVAVTQAFFAQVRFPLPSLFFNSRASCAQLLLGFLPSSTFGGCHRGCPIRPSLQHSMPSTECHCLLDFLVANRACPYHGVICWCLQCSKDNSFSTIQF